MFKKMVGLMALILSFNSFAESANIWASIPFVRGGNLCNYRQAFSQDRSSYMREMTNLASDLLYAGAKGDEALSMLTTFDALYDKNVYLATQGRYLDVTLESTLKSYVDQYVRAFNIKNKKINFVHMNNIRNIVRGINSHNQRDGYLPNQLTQALDYVAYGSYSYAPDCKGGILVTITLVNSSGITTSFKGEGQPKNVMAQVAYEMIKEFQKPKYPVKVDFGNSRLRVLGTLNDSVGHARNYYDAESECRQLGGRLPREQELVFLSRIGFWNGGIDMPKSRDFWWISGSQAYSADYRKPTPRDWTNGHGAKFICVAN